MVASCLLTGSEVWEVELFGVEKGSPILRDGLGFRV